MTSNNVIKGNFPKNSKVASQISTELTIDYSQKVRVKDLPKLPTSIWTVPESSYYLKLKQNHVFPEFSTDGYKRGTSLRTYIEAYLSETENLERRQALRAWVHVGMGINKKDFIELIQFILNGEKKTTYSLSEFLAEFGEGAE